MEKYIYDNSNGLWYELHGDYYLPCLVIPEEEIHTIGIWGRKHLQYLIEHRPMLYNDLILSGKLRVHDVCHTHASLLIDMGCTPLLVAERLGHERVQTTMETYSHLYPNKQTEVAAQLDAIATNDDGYEKMP